MTVIRSPIRPVIFSPIRQPTTLYKGGGAAPFDAVSFFADGEAGSLLEIDRPETLWRDTAATLPATAVNTHTLGRIDDRSGNSNHALQSSSTNRPLLGVDSAGSPLCAWDYLDDSLDFTTDLPGSTTVSMVIAYDPTLLPPSTTMALGPTTSNTPWTFGASAGSASTTMKSVDAGGVTGFWVDGVAASYATRGDAHAALLLGSVMEWQWSKLTTTTMRRIGRYHTTSDVHTMKFRKLMMMDRAITADERAALVAAWKM